MSSITIDVSEALAKIDPVQMEKAIEASMKGASDLVRADVKQYPPPPASSTYARTGTLGRSWASRVSGLRAVIGNITGYAPYVQGADTQAWMHKGRWRTTADVARQMADPVKRFIEAALARWAR